MALFSVSRCFLGQAGQVKAPLQFIQDIIRAQAQVTEHDQAMKPQIGGFINQLAVVPAVLTVLGCQQGFRAFLADLLEDLVQSLGMQAGHIG